MPKILKFDWVRARREIPEGQNLNVLRETANGLVFVLKLPKTLVNSASKRKLRNSRPVRKLGNTLYFKIQFELYEGAFKKLAMHE